MAQAGGAMIDQQ